MYNRGLMNPRCLCGLDRVHKTPSELELRDYEIVWILGGGAGEKEGDASVERVRALVDSLGGEIGNVNPWGKRNLAYPIEKQTEGFYVEAQFKLDPARSPELDRACNADRQILRHLIVKK